MPNKARFLPSTDLLADSLALIGTAAQEAIAARGRFILSLSGGNTPKPIYAALAESKQDWKNWVLTFGDERCVPPEDAQSNYHMVHETLLAPLGQNAPKVLRMKGEIDPAVAARDYENELRQLAGDEPILRHDLILLGMGPDGHTASLFPGTPALHEHTRLIIENYVPKFSMWRITFTYPLLNAARQVCFLVSSAGKESVLKEIQHNEGDYPCRHVRPTDGTLTWLIGGE
jgi:6-phosphogluconolactonase